MPQVSRAQYVQRGSTNIDQFPRQLGKYTLLRRLAVGGMAELFLAQLEGAEGARKDVVIKRILPALAQDEDFVARFLNEARLAAMLNHASVVRTYDLGRADGTLFLAQEYVDGVDVRQLGRMLQWSGRLMPPGIAAVIAARVAEALDYAHRLCAPSGSPLGLVHRDVSPDNVLVTRDGYVKLVDFGVAKAFAAAPKVTRGILGKSHYMSPEQALGKPLDGRSDLFSLGVLIYVLTTGADPFEGEGDYAVLSAVVNQAPRAPSQRVPGYPAALERIVLQALSKKPEDRQANAAELAARLTEFARDLGQHLTARELADFVTQLLEAPQSEKTAGKSRFTAPAMPSVAELSAVSDELEPLPIDTIQRLPAVLGPAVASDTARDLGPVEPTVDTRGLIAGPVVVPLPAALKNRPPPPERTGETRLTALRVGPKTLWIVLAVVLAVALTFFFAEGDTEPAPRPAEPGAALRKSQDSDTRARELPAFPAADDEVPRPTTPPQQLEGAPAAEPAPQRRR